MNPRALALSLVLGIVSILRGAPPASCLGGDWPVRANGFNGQLHLAVADDGNLRGTLFGNSIAGQFDITNGLASFKRLVRQGAHTRVGQVYEGKLMHPDSFRPDVRFLAGTFVEPDAPFVGGEPCRYTWVAVVHLDTQPRDLVEVQGTWRVIDSFGFSKSPLDSLGLAKVGNRVTIGRDQWIVDGDEVATLTNAPFVLPRENAYFRRNLRFTLSDGRRIEAAYRGADGKLELVSGPDVVWIGGAQARLERVPEPPRDPSSPTPPPPPVAREPSP